MTKYVFVCKNGDVEQKITKTQIEDEKIFKLVITKPLWI